MDEIEFHEVTILFRADREGLKEFILSVEKWADKFESKSIYEFVAIMHTLHGEDQNG